MPRSIDISSFDCACGHRSTVPAALNWAHNDMATHSVYHPTVSKDAQGNNVYTPQLSATQQSTLLTQLQAQYKGNTISIVLKGNNEQHVVFTVSDAKVGFQDNIDVTQSNHIRLDCPQCGKTIYEVKWN